MARTIKRVDKSRAGNFDFYGFPEMSFYSGAVGVECEHRVVTGGSGKEEFGGMKIAEIFVRRFRLGLAVGDIPAQGLDVERQQHRHRTLGEAGKALLG